MDIKQLEYFLAIAEEKNITKAAEKLRMAQPPLSHQLKNLEDQLGVKLVERSTRKLEITDAGQVLQRKAKQILALVDGTLKELQDVDNGLQGILSIGTINTVGATLLEEIVVDFHKKYPGINFHIVHDDTVSINELICSGILEVGIVRTPVNKELFESINLPDDPMIAIGSSSYFENKQGFVNLKELQDKPLIVQRRFEKMIVDLCGDAGFEPKIFCRSNDVITILSWAKLEMGIAIVPKTCSKLINNTNLIYKEIEGSLLDVGSAVVYLKDRYLSFAARHFLKNFKSYIEKA